MSVTERSKVASSYPDLCSKDFVRLNWVNEEREAGEQWEPSNGGKYAVRRQAELENNGGS